MGVINKIRERTGLAVGIIAVGLILFLVGGDLLSANSTLLGGNQQTIAEIDGEDISLSTYQALLREISQQYRLNYGRAPDASALRQLREQAWLQLIQQHAYTKHYEALGLETTNRELIDLVQGDHIHPQLKQTFVDSVTGVFKKEMLQDYLRELPSAPPNRQIAWHNFEKSLIPTRTQEKYTQLLSKSTYITTAEIEQAQRIEKESINIRYVYVPYSSLPDSSFSATESEKKAYLASHANDFQRKESRSMYYVSLTTIPTAADSADIRQAVEQLKEPFLASSEDSIFSSIHSESLETYTSYTPSQLPEYLSKSIDTLNVGEVTGPVLERGNYVLCKLSGLLDTDQPEARASHILFKTKEGEPKGPIRKEAQRILQRLKKGESFEELASAYGQDNTSGKGGDLGWFGKGRMVAPFEKAVFDAKSKGLLPKLVETEFGFHIIKITEVASSSSYQIARIEKEILASDLTRNELYQKLSNLAIESHDINSFLAYTEANNLYADHAKEVLPVAQNIGTLSEARNIVYWLYNEAKAGAVSEVFELTKEFVVAIMIDHQEEGTAKYENAEKELEKLVIQEKKAEQIKAILAKATGSFEEIAQNFSLGNAFVYSMTGVKFSDSYIQNVGEAPEVIGLAFSTPSEGEPTEPIATNTGVVLLMKTGQTEDSSSKDASQIRKKLTDAQRAKAIAQLAEAIEELNSIEDYRYKFF